MSIMNDKKNISIVIVNYNTSSLLKQCIASIYNSKISYFFEIIVVDNASADDSCLMVNNNFPEVILIDNKENLGFSKANNLGIQNSTGDYILFLNSDTIVIEDSINKLIRFLDVNIAATAVGPKLLNFDKSIQRSWFDFPNPLKTFSNLLGISFYIVKLKKFRLFTMLFGKSHKPAFLLNSIDEQRQVDYLTLACLLVRKKDLIKTGNLDENIFFYHEDCELGYKFRKNNMKTFYLPSAPIIHLGGSSSQKRILASFKQYYINLLYVFKKYEKAGAYGLMKNLMIIALSVRVFLWFFGVYRYINMFGVYSGNPMRNDAYRPKSKDVLMTYINLIKKIV